MRKRKKPTPWQKIIHACDSERGTRLTAEDCYMLGFDDAIRTRARLDDEGKDSDQDDDPECRTCPMEPSCTHPDDCPQRKEGD